MSPTPNVPNVPHQPTADRGRTPPPTAAPLRCVPPRLTEGTELVGEFVGSGYREPPHLVQRFDGQVVHLQPLLYQAARLVARQERRERTARAGGPAAGPAAMAEIADRLSRATGRRFAAEHIVYLIDNKLAPLGITHHSDGSPPDLPEANHALTLKHRKAVVPERVSWIIAGIFAWLFNPLVLMPVVTAFMAGEVWVFLTQDVGAAVARSMAGPGSVVTIVLLTLLSSAFHECGHAAACRYGKVRPGPMGCGIYLVWPAFYTDVTNSYRLGRAGRLRTDLGGVYFNAIFVLVLAAVHAGTHNPLVLAAILFTNLEMFQQLLPSLRFDGYYIISDLVGIPDLFKYIGPILRRAFLRRPADARLKALKKWPQTVVTIWVLTVLPAIAVQLAVVVYRLPQWAANAYDSVTGLAEKAASDDTSILGWISAFIQIALVLLPLLGVVLVVWQLLISLVRFLARRFLSPRAQRSVALWTSARGRYLLLFLLALPAVGVIAWAFAPSPGFHAPAASRIPSQPPYTSVPSPASEPTPSPRATTPASERPGERFGRRSGAGSGVGAGDGSGDGGRTSAPGTVGGAADGAGRSGTGGSGAAQGPDTGRSAGAGTGGAATGQDGTAPAGTGTGRTGGSPTTSSTRPNGDPDGTRRRSGGTGAGSDGGRSPSQAPTQPPAADDSSDESCTTLLGLSLGPLICH